MLKHVVVLSVVLLAGCGSVVDPVSGQVPAAPSVSATPTPEPTPEATPATVKPESPVASSKAPAATKTPPAAPRKTATPSPTFTEHNSGEGNDECFVEGDCGYRPAAPDLERQALEAYWDSLGYSEVIELCSGFRTDPVNAAQQWKTATGNSLSVTDIADWFTIQCVSSGI